jgi:hypothetical protein
MAQESARITRQGAGWRSQADESAHMTDLGSWLSLGEAEETQAPRGEIVLVLARWVLIVVGMGLTLNAPSDLSDLQVTIVGILALAGVNFWLHTNLVMRRRSSHEFLYWTSGADIAVITAVVAITGGFDSYAFVFYYPAILTFSLVFPFRITAYLTGAMACLYAAILPLVSASALDADPEGFPATLVARLMSFVAVMAVANMYRWVEFRRLEDEKASVKPPRPAKSRTRASGAAGRPAGS